MASLVTTEVVPLTHDQAHALVDAVMERDDLAVTATAFEDQETGAWVFEATCEGDADLESFSELARLTLGTEIGFSSQTIDPSVNWVAKSLEGLKPVTAGGFYVHGSHDTAHPAGVTPIRIDAAQAFGTGHHETTSGCLEALDTLMRRRRFRNPIDVGTGTGVLAIAIAKRLRVPVLATDIDPIAVRTTIDNARDNETGPLIRSIVATGLDHNEIHWRAPYDLIVANILAGPLIELAPSMGYIAQKGAVIVLSGLLETQAGRVQTAYARAGMVQRRRLVRGEWATLVLEKL
ncbi:MAG TPA: 50S ribosomal protein L11 methyltransferase [Devosia sp.]|nr:50S ribosomal protein L11 methyltransferase [Devosia sp.]